MLCDKVRKSGMIVNKKEDEGRNADGSDTVRN